MVVSTAARCRISSPLNKIYHMKTCYMIEAQMLRPKAIFDSWTANLSHTLQHFRCQIVSFVYAKEDKCRYIPI